MFDYLMLCHTEKNIVHIMHVPILINIIHIKKYINNKYTYILTLMYIYMLLSRIIIYYVIKKLL